jgi:hypothetical protein
MNELKLIFLILRGLFKLADWVLSNLVRLLARLVRGARRRLRGEAAPEAPPPAKLPKPGRAAAVPERTAAERLAGKLRGVAVRAREVEARCAGEPLCAPLLPTLRDFVLPRLDAALTDLRRATGATDLRPIASSGAYLEALTQLLGHMADQRRDESLDELIDDADTLAEACYQPIVDSCRANDVPLSSNRTATLFGDGCSPFLGRIDDPTGLAILHLPWKWLAEVHRWPAIGHEVGHDFYESVDGLDDEVLRRHGLSDLVDDAEVLDGSQGVTMRDIDRIVTTWRRELIADAFGVMMFGPAYVVTTAAIFARPGDPREALAVEVDESGASYEVHPPGHVRVAAACRLLARMGYGALGVQLEQRWRAQHGAPAGILLAVADGWLRVPDEPFLDRAVALTASLYQEGFSALRGIPLASMPGFDFGPREHEAALRARDAFLAGGPPSLRDARLLIAGAVLAWAERPQDAVRLLRAARLAVGKLPLRVPGDGAATLADGAGARELVRDAFLLDLLLSPPVSARRAETARR